MQPGESIHLGDGSYLTFSESLRSFIITANHHDPAEATDSVFIEFRSAAVLIKAMRETLEDNP